MLEELENKIGYTFKNKKLLRQALTHTSYAYENNVESYEKLEFLGDSILEFISSKYLFANYSKLTEGEMTKVRADAVCEDSLYRIGVKLNFSDFFYLGKSERQTHRGKKSIHADCVEAIIAAIYLDSNLEEAEKFILTHINSEIEYASKNVGLKDYKTVLQEKLQENGEIEIKYNIINEVGPDHNKVFTSQVELNGTPLAIGIGHSKKGAEMEAARKALENLNK